MTIQLVLEIVMLILCLVSCLYCMAAKALVIQFMKTIIETFKEQS